jgi:hypothetical protein
MTLLGIIQERFTVEKQTEIILNYEGLDYEVSIEKGSLDPSVYIQQSQTKKVVFESVVLSKVVLYEDMDSLDFVNKSKEFYIDLLQNGKCISFNTNNITGAATSDFAGAAKDMNDFESEGAFR